MFSYYIALIYLMLFSMVSEAGPRPDSHAPISVMADHIHKKGEAMLSYRYMSMSMQGNRSGKSDIRPQEIATGAPNLFAGQPMMPATLRVVPTKMTMDMHMFGAMYAPSDQLTLMAMANIVQKKMDHITFMGASGSNILGDFSTSTKGFGDLSLSALIKILSSTNHKAHLTAGLSLPTGSIKKTDEILTPMNMRPSAILPYPMQLGSGTVDAIAGITYSGSRGALSWGGQTRSILRLGNNSRGYSLGDEHTAQAWLSSLINSQLSVSLRAAYFHRSNITNTDSEVMLPVQSADPNRQKINRLDIGVGLNFIVPNNLNRLAIEYTIPIHQQLAGPQLKNNWGITIGWQLTL